MRNFDLQDMVDWLDAQESAQREVSAKVVAMRGQQASPRAARRQRDLAAANSPSRRSRFPGAQRQASDANADLGHEGGTR